MLKYSLSGLLLILFLHLAGAQEEWYFDFGGSSSGACSVNTVMKFSSDVGYGFDFENSDLVRIIKADSKQSGGTARDIKGFGYCTSDEPFYFSVRVPEGNYMVSIKLGNPGEASVTTIKAEARRLMLWNYRLDQGESRSVTFLVNVRSPKINETRSIELKPREANYMNWDDRLSLEFSGENQAVHSILIKPAENITTVFLAGNSTVTDQDLSPWASWGQMITEYFDTNIVVANFAESGASLASFKGRGRLDKVLSLICPGDYLFIEFGHNDQKRKGEGIGPWTSFSELLREFIASAREKGAYPVCVTPTQRRSFNEEGKIVDTHGDYPDAMRSVAEELDVPLIDLNEMTRVLYESWGPELSRKAFVQYPAGTFPGQKEELKDNTHFNSYGAHEIAQCILQGIFDLNLGLEDHIVRFNAPYNPAEPNLPDEIRIPESPRYINTKPEEN